MGTVLKQLENRPHYFQNHLFIFSLQVFYPGRKETPLYAAPPLLPGLTSSEPSSR